MGFGYGPGADMQKVNRVNLSQLGKNKRSLQDITRDRNQKDFKITDKEISESELEQLRAELQEKRKKENLRKLLFMVVIGGVVVSGFVLLLN